MEREREIERERDSLLSLFQSAVSFCKRDRHRHRHTESERERKMDRERERERTSSLSPFHSAVSVCALLKRRIFRLRKKEKERARHEERVIRKRDRGGERERDM